MPALRPRRAAAHRRWREFAADPASSPSPTVYPARRIRASSCAAVARPMRQVERDDPSHRTPPTSKNAAPAPRAQQLHLPVLPVQPIEVFCGEGCGEIASGCGGIGLARLGSFRRVVPAAEEECGDAALAGGKLQAARRGQGQARRFANDGGEAATFQPFLSPGSTSRSFHVSQ